LFWTFSFIRSCQSTTIPTPEVQPQSQTGKGFVTLLYIKGISEKIARTLNCFNVNPTHKPVKTVGSILKKPKDKFDQDLLTGVVYKISCKDCEEVYIGQISHTLKSRTREHKRAVFSGDKNSLLVQHCGQTNHDFNFDDVEIVDRCSQWSRRLFLEAWHSIREPNSINEHMHIPEMYKILANP